MAKSKKKHYYVLVLTEEGPKFVTSVNWSTKTAKWDMLEKPLEFETKSIAEDLVLGLNLNMSQAFLIQHNWEIECQPFRYAEGKFEWKWNKNTESEE